MTCVVQVAMVVLSSKSLSSFFFQSNNLKAEACLQTEQVGDSGTDSFIVWTFSGVQVPKSLSVGFLIFSDPVVLKFSTHNHINFLFGKASFQNNVK